MEEPVNGKRAERAVVTCWCGSMTSRAGQPGQADSSPPRGLRRAEPEREARKSSDRANREPGGPQERLATFKNTINVRIARTEAQLPIGRIGHNNSFNSAPNLRIVPKRLERTIVSNIHDIDHALDIRRGRQKPNLDAPGLVTRHPGAHQGPYRKRLRHHHLIQVRFTVSSLNLSIIFRGICHSNPAPPEVVT